MSALLTYLFVLGSPIDRENFLGREINAQANAFIPKMIIGLRSESRQAKKRGKRREQPGRIGASLFCLATGATEARGAPAFLSRQAYTRMLNDYSGNYSLAALAAAGYILLLANWGLIAAP